MASPAYRPDAAPVAWAVGLAEAMGGAVAEADGVIAGDCVPIPDGRQYGQRPEHVRKLTTDSTLQCHSGRLIRWGARRLETRKCLRLELLRSAHACGISAMRKYSRPSVMSVSTH